MVPEASPVLPLDEPHEAEEPAPAKTRPSRAPSPPPRVRTELPPLDLLRTAPPSTTDGVDEKDVMEALERTLTTFGVDAQGRRLLTAARRSPCTRWRSPPGPRSTRC